MKASILTTQHLDRRLCQQRMRVAGGEYSNFVVVTHSPAEFVLDFRKIACCDDLK